MLTSLEERVGSIEQRNRRVEREKAWEVSWTRRILIAILTYIIFVIFFLVADLPRPWLNPIVPTIAFLLSTMSLSAARHLWIRRQS